MTIHSTIANKQALKLEDIYELRRAFANKKEAMITIVHAGIVDINMSCLNSRHLQVLAG